MATYARNDQVRAHLFMDGVGTPSPDPLYWPVLGVAELNRDLGETTEVEVPDPNRYGEFLIVDQMPGQKGKWTTSLTTRLQVGVESPLRKLANMGCPTDVHLNRGVCDVPTNYNTFSELEIWEDMRVTSYSTSALAALSSDARESTTESVDVSIGKAYKIYNMNYAISAAIAEASAVSKGVAFAPSWCCGTVQCSILFAASAAKVYFIKKGTAVATDIANIGGLTVLGNRLVLGIDSVGLKLMQFDSNGFITAATTDRAIDGISTIESIHANSIYGIVSSALKVTRFDLSSSTLTTTDLTSLAGAAATKIVDVYVADDGTAVALSDKAYPAYSKDGKEWSSATVLTGTGTPVGTAIAAINSETWLAGTSTGEIYMTADHGTTWTKVLDVTGSVNDIKVASKHVLYATVGSAVYRSVDGGASWSLEPAVLGRTFPNVTSTHKIAICADDINNIAVGVVSGSALKLVIGRPG